MTIRNHTAMAALIATLTAPAHADVFHDNVPTDPARPGWRPPATRPHIPMAGHYYDFDPDTGPLAFPSIQDPFWPGPFGTWGWGAGASETPIPLPPPTVVRRCRPPAVVPKKVPGPLPVLGLGAAFAYSRRLRQRLQP